MSSRGLCLRSLFQLLGSWGSLRVRCLLHASAMAWGGQMASGWGCPQSDQGWLEDRGSEHHPGLQEGGGPEVESITSSS